MDAVVADPPSRQQVAGEVDAIAGDVTVPPPSDPKLQLDLSADVPEGPIPFPEAAFFSLRLRFLSWEAAEPRLLEDVQQTPRLVMSRRAPSSWVSWPPSGFRHWHI